MCYKHTYIKGTFQEDTSPNFLNHPPSYWYDKVHPPSYWYDNVHPPSYWYNKVKEVVKSATISISVAISYMFIIDVHLS